MSGKYVLGKKASLAGGMGAGDTFPSSCKADGKEVSIGEQKSTAP